MKRVLFICTGNYYRSRFAEELFNALASDAHAAWQADSRGLLQGNQSGNIGPIASVTQEALAARGIKLSLPIRFPKKLVEDDLFRADRIIALNEKEHRPLIAYLFPDWTEKVEYWKIGDMDVLAPQEGILQIEQHVKELFHALTAAS
jgi:protein-tyrosine phosphatase